MARGATRASFLRLRKEITIAGGGLAGLALGIGLRRRGLPVSLHEAGRYPRHRVCGEFISGVSDETLKELGIEGELAVASRHQQVIWYRAGRRLLESELPVPARAISRYKLDVLLRDRLLAVGGVVHELSRRSDRQQEGTVWSAGRVARRDSGWIGLKYHALELTLERGLEMHLGCNGYLGLTSVEEGKTNVCGLFKIDRRHHGKNVDLMMTYLRAGGNGDLADRLESAGRDESSFTGVSAFELGWQAPLDGQVAVGDAAGMIPPFTGNGMSMAFESAELALHPLEKWAAGAASWSDTVKEVRRTTIKKFRRRVANAMAIHRVLLNNKSQRLIAVAAATGLVPLRPLLSLVR